jgi:hypothetical protein
VPQQKRPITELRFPIGGLDRQAGFDQQPPYSTPYCVNVRPFDVVNLASAQLHGMRHRGGARPGLEKSYAQQIGMGPIQMLSTAGVMGSNGATSYYLLAVSAGTLYQNSSGSMSAVGGHLNPTGPLQCAQIGQYVYIADYRPVNVTGSNGTIANGNQLSDASIADWTALSIDTGKDVVWISGNVDSESNIFPIISCSTGHLVFSGTMTNQTGGATWQIGRIPKVFDTKNPTATLTGLCGTLPIPAANYVTGTVTSAGGIVTLTGGSWSGVPSPTAANMLTLTIPNVSGIGTQDYLVASLDSGTQLTLIDQTNDANCTGQPYALSWYSPTPGLPPLNCRLCCSYRGRLMLAGWPSGVWYASRVNAPTDWDYGYDPSDPSRAIGGSSETAGGVPDDLTALMPHSDSYLIFACERSLWLMNGDPAFGGQIQSLSRGIGVLGPGAWTNMADGSMLILSRDGLYQIPPGASSYPQPVSRAKLPAELLDVDWWSNSVSMVHDVWARGVHLSVTPSDGTAGQHWFVDSVVAGFWPVVLPNGMQPTAMVEYAPDSSSPSQIILAGYDGYLRNYSPTATSDDGIAIVSAVVYGPFRLGGPGYNGQILQIAADLDANGQSVAWGIFSGETAQAAVAAAVTAGTSSAANWNGTFAAGANHRDYPRASGVALCIMVSGSYGWAIEGVRIESRQLGALR